MLGERVDEPRCTLAGVFRNADDCRINNFCRNNWPTPIHQQLNAFVCNGATHRVDVPRELRFAIQHVVLLATMHRGDVMLIDAKWLFSCELAFKWCQSLGELSLDRENDVSRQWLPVDGDTQRVNDGLLQRIEFSIHDMHTL